MRAIILLLARPLSWRSRSYQGCERICIFCNGVSHTLFVSTSTNDLTRLTSQVDRCVSAMSKLLKIYSKGSLPPSFGPLTLCIDVPQTSVDTMTLDSVIQSAAAGLSSGSRYEVCRFLYAIPLLIKIQPGSTPEVTKKGILSHSPPSPLPPPPFSTCHAATTLACTRTQKLVETALSR